MSIEWVSLLVLLPCILLSGCSKGAAGSPGTEDDTREMAGTIPVSLPAPTSINVALKFQTTLSCPEVQVCCAAYNGELSVVTVKDDCTFTIPLPLNNFCYCALFSGTDADGNGCGDDYIGSMGCTENGYAGIIPIFPDVGGAIDTIDLGNTTVEGKKVIATGNPCAQVDQDGDNTSDAEDDDDDDDGTLDVDDLFNTLGCETADTIDSDGDGVPDIYEDFWADAIGGEPIDNDVLEDFLTDSDGDGVPDGCDVDFGCAPDETDTDGNCIPDELDSCLIDNDEDGLPICFGLDCDDNDPDLTNSLACFDLLCDTDFDEDGIGFCDDCDDLDPTNTSELCNSTEL